jgi:electron transfer flavoprotein beta subunit
MHEDGYDVCELAFPAVLTVVKGINTPRVPTLKGRIASQKCEIPVWKPSDIGADIDKIGLDGSPTRVVKTAQPKSRNTITKKIEGVSKNCAKELVRELRLRSIL